MDGSASAGVAYLLASPLVWLPHGVGRTFVGHFSLVTSTLDESSDMLCSAVLTLPLSGTSKVQLAADFRREAVARTSLVPPMDIAARITSLLVTGPSNSAM